MFLKKIGKKIIFAIRRKKAFFLDFYKVVNYLLLSSFEPFLLHPF